MLVSVLMSSYNHGKYISEAIESVLNQTVKDFELVIVDDFSTDNSRGIIDEYRRKDRRIRVLFHRRNMGISATFNDLIAEAKGQYVAILASDDVWIESKLEKQLEVLTADGSLIVWSEGEVIDSNSMPTGGTFTSIYATPATKKSGQILEQLLCGNFIFGSSLLYKTEYAKKLHYDERLKFLNDYKVMIDLAENYSFFFIEEPLAKYRIHGRNSILSYEESWIREAAVISQYLLKKYGNRMSEDAKLIMFKRLTTYYLSANSKLARYYLLQTFKKERSLDNLIYLVMGDKTPQVFINFYHLLVKHFL
ncbi:MAG TPA: glycosyltransferase [Candidatus Sulfotelmatobacter sp.]|nr:glycosyltransferase [Candidatus Sulfotelmatobacter sp.]